MPACDRYVGINYSDAMGANVGAVIGSVAPGPGKAVRAVAGSGIGVAVDMGVLAAEKRRTREDIMRDLLDSIIRSNVAALRPITRLNVIVRFAVFKDKVGHLG